MIYDNSKLQQFKNCPESYRLKYVKCLKKVEEGDESHDKNFGSAVHAGLEAYYKGEGIDKAKASFSNKCPIQLEQTDLAKTQENGLVLLDAYVKHYAEEDKKWTVKSVEVVDTFKLTDTIEFQVKIDLVVEQQGCIYFVDHKTTGKAFNWTYWGQFDPNSQITAYTAYCKAKFGECSGGIINGIQFGHRQRAYKGEPAGFHFEFQRQLFNRNQGQIEAWKQDTLWWIKALSGMCEATNHIGAWKKNEGQCRFCSYKPICISCADESVIEQLYERVNPNEYLEEKEVAV